MKSLQLLERRLFCNHLQFLNGSRRTEWQWMKTSCHVFGISWCFCCSSPWFAVLHPCLIADCQGDLGRGSLNLHHAAFVLILEVRAWRMSSHQYASRQRERLAIAELPWTGPCTAHVDHVVICPHCHVALGGDLLKLKRHLLRHDHRIEPCIPRHSLLPEPRLEVMNARTAVPRAQGSEVPRERRLGCSLPYTVELKLAVPEWLMPSPTYKILCLVVDVNLLVKHQLNPTAVWKSPWVAKQLRRSIKTVHLNLGKCL